MKKTVQVIWLCLLGCLSFTSAAQERVYTVGVANFQAHQFIVALKALGCQFALDDFGSGQSSFRYLKQLPVDYLKIDGSFVKSMLTDKTNEALVRGMQEIAQSLGIMTIAEFVETDDIAQALTTIDIDYGQGWYFHKAEPIYKLLE